MEKDIEKLEREGWTRRFVANEPRLREAVDMYRESGFEVHLEPMPKRSDCETCSSDNGAEECTICFEGSEDQYMIIYTRSINEKT
jgi:hypothetical protein